MGVCYAGSNVSGIVVSQDYTCPPHYYCPNTTASNPASLPRLCPATKDCTMTRLYNGWCEPQGPYEPMVCPAGHYCPEPSTKYPCPEGYFCPYGTISPRSCGPIAHCPVGSVGRTELTALVFLLIIDALLISLGVYFKYRGRRKDLLVQRRKSSPMNLQHDGPSSSLSSTVPILHESSLTTPPTHSLPLSHPPRESSDIELSSGTSTVLRYRPKASTPPDSSFPSSEKSSKVSRLLEGYPQGNLQGPQYQLTLSFHNLSFHLPSGKALLEDMSGTVRPGRFTAIMGPSGAGKTTLMRALMGKLQGIEGETRVSQVPIEMKKLERLIGYVPQEDTMLRELTAREIMYHSASVRLPRSWSSTQKKRYADAVMEALGLGEDVADVLVGDENTRGLSGGQRKRLNIGMELVATPLALFLDEPTTGLDATVALALSDTLREISHLGLTVLSILHQPRPEIFHSFDDVLLLAPGGHMAFQGSVLDAVPYFTSLGFYFPPKVNPADVLMDILSGHGLWDLYRRAHPVRDPAGSDPHQGSDNPSFDDLSPPTALANRQQDEGGSDSSSSSNTRWTTRARQLLLCLSRALLQQYRRPRTLIFEYGVAAIAGILLGVAVMHWDGEFYIGVLLPPYTSISASPRITTMPEMCLFITASVAISGCPAAVLTFGEEKPVYWREAGSGHSRIAYFLGKVLSTIPRLLLGSLHYTAFFHLLAHSPLPLSDLYPLVLLQYFCVYGASEAISLAFSRSNGTLIASIATLIVAVFNGYGPSYTDAQKWHLSWFWDMCYTRWFTEAFISAYTLPYRDLYDVEGSMAVLGYTLDRFIMNMCLPFVIGIILRIIGFMILVGLNRNQQK
ncbi:MAG: hypothetical protein DHS80DRAFT_16527 [Piptocephalis tieghemiana]|nr:MAG: hypothetical protein DHS80DRAFT_16527 [Piptocephalis tieghemiana]